MINGNGGIWEGREYVARLEFRLCSIFVPEDASKMVS